MRWRWMIPLLVALCALTLLPWLGSSRSAAETTGVVTRQLQFMGNRYTVVSLDLSKVQLKLFWKDSSGKKLGSLRALEAYLHKNGRELLAAMNAGIFDQSFTPLGLHVERGQTLHSLKLRRKGYGNFYLQPNAVFYLDAGGAHILDTLEYAARPPKALESTQSGPALLLRGKINPAFQADSSNRLLRNAIGISSRTAVHLVISDDWVNFTELARLFRDALHCTDALYLDGNISRLRLPGSRDEDGEFAGMIGVIR